MNSCPARTQHTFHARSISGQTLSAFMLAGYKGEGARDLGRASGPAHQLQRQAPLPFEGADG